MCLSRSRLLPISRRHADRLIETARDWGRILQVGHLEQFNPAVAAIEKIVRRPLFFEVHRMNLFSPRSLDVDIVRDLMIHDLDIVVALAGEEPEEIRAAGVSILSDKVDIGNVRLQFRGGCVANLTASRVSTERVRKLRLFQPHEYISLDYTKQHAVKFTRRRGSARFRSPSYTQCEGANRWRYNSEAFLASVAARTKAETGWRGRALCTLKVALAILDKIKQHSQIVAESLVTGWTP